MPQLFKKTRLLLSCLVLSVLAHFLPLYAWRMFGTYDFSAPVSQLPLIMVELQNPAGMASLKEYSTVPEKDNSNKMREKIPTERPPTAATNNSDESPSSINKPQGTPEINSVEKIESTRKTSAESNISLPETVHQHTVEEAVTSPLSKTSNFLATKNETLTYQISMLGVPIGSAELEAINKSGEIWITLRVKSNAAISSFYPVDDVVETRHIDGKYIMTKIKQREGAFKSDEGFTINLRKKRVSWYDNIGGRSLTTSVPTDRILDTLSGIYYLRNRQLHIGSTETLHIFDSESYAEVPVNILRRETIRLPNFTQVTTVVVQPHQSTTGMFRRTGDLMIWITDDEFKVPVKISTTVALGAVSIELVSAESSVLENGKL